MDRTNQTTLTLTPAPEPDPAVVAAIEDLLEMAKAGELLGFVCVSHLTGEECMTSIGGVLDVHQTISFAERVKFEAMARWTAGDYAEGEE